MPQEGSDELVKELARIHAGLTLTISRLKSLPVRSSPTSAKLDDMADDEAIMPVSRRRA